ncbi:MAG TPA: DUF4386 domain-containing protein [Steroidobacteraceae bacterium]|nr:DUF4386 domain-containing protein [Steroidobacteraceae bacterium]
MEFNKKNARIAGAWYVLFVLPFFYSLGYVPGRFLIEGDAAATIKAIQDGELLFRLGIVVGMIACVVYLFLLAALYKLLRPVSQYASVMMVGLGVAHLPLFFTGHIDQLNLLALLNGKGYETAFTTEQLHAQVLLRVSGYWSSVHVNEFFMGIWLLPFGYLVFKSGFLPKIIGVWLAFNSLPYLTDFVRQMLDPGLTFPMGMRYTMMFALFGEYSIGLWLLIMGAKEIAPKSDVHRPVAAEY